MSLHGTKLKFEAAHSEFERGVLAEQLTGTLGTAPVSAGPTASSLRQHRTKWVPLNWAPLRSQPQAPMLCPSADKEGIDMRRIWQWRSRRLEPKWLRTLVFLRKFLWIPTPNSSTIDQQSTLETPWTILWTTLYSKTHPKSAKRPPRDPQDTPKRV